jgi:hypothetical protein
LQISVEALMIQLLSDLQIRHFDLSAILEKAMKESVHVEDGDGDIIHPGGELSALFAQYLFEKGLLQQN